MTFSPSQTTQYIECPTRHHLSRVQGWRSRVLSRRDAAAIVGSAFAAGIAGHNWARRDMQDGPLLIQIDAPDIARLEAERQIERLIAHGCVIPATLRADFDYAPTIAARAVERVCADDPIPADWTIVDVERPFPDHGNARPDLVCKDGDALVIVDYKVAMALKDPYVAERLDTYRRSWQMAHYVWAARQVYGEPYTDFERFGPDGVQSIVLKHAPANVTRYAIVLVRIEPWRVVLQPYTVDERLLRLWASSARETWWRMANSVPGATPPMHWTACETKFGQCEMFKACWDHDQDPALMTLDYVKVPRQAAEEAA